MILKVMVTGVAMGMFGILMAGCGGQDQMTADGARSQAAAVHGGDSNVKPTPTPTPDPYVPPGTDVTPTPAPAAGPAGDWDSEVVNAAGTTQWLSQMYGSQYLVVDFSSINCSACVALADSHNKDTAFGALFAPSNKCGFVTVVPRGEIGPWTGRYGAGVVGSRSYGTVEGTSVVASKLGINLDAIPRVLIVDRQGVVVGSGLGEMPSNLNSKCQ